MKEVIVIALLIGIVGSLGQALMAMSRGPDPSGRMVRALSVRVGLSILLFAVLMIGHYLGLIEPNG